MAYVVLAAVVAIQQYFIAVALIAIKAGLSDIGIALFDKFQEVLRWVSSLTIL